MEGVNIIALLLGNLALVIFGMAFFVALGLLIAPLVLLGVSARPIVAWTACRALAATLRGDDPRPWVPQVSTGA